MGRLLADFVKRWRWVFLFAVPYAMFLAPDERNSEPPFGAAVMLLGAILCAWEGRQGLFKVYGTLPLARRTTVNVILAESAFLFPLLFLCVEVLRWLSHLAGFTHANGPAIAAVLSVIGVGYASLIMLTVTTGLTGASKIRPPVLGALWGVTFFAALEGLRFIHLSPQEALAFPNEVAMGIAVILAFVCRLQLRRLPGLSVSRAVAAQIPVAAPRRSAPTYPPRIRGRLAPLLRTLMLMAVMISCVFGPYFLIPWWTSRGETAPTWVSADIWSLVSVIVIAKLTLFAPVFVLIPTTQWIASIRALRALPCSRIRLTILLLIIPGMSALMVIAPVLFLLLIMARAIGAIDATARIPETLVTSGMNLEGFFMLPGFIFLGLAAYVRFGLIPLLLLVVGGQVFTGLSILRVKPIGVILPPGGIAAGTLAIILMAAACWILHLLLARSSSVYRPRQSGISGWARQ